MTSELACVVMSLRNEPGLTASVQSLLDQSDDVEIVVVNTGGGNPADTLATAGISVPVIAHPERLYPGAVRNIGIENSTARYVAFLEADCVALPGWAAARIREHKAGADAVASSITNAYPDNACAWAGFLLVDDRRTHVTPAHRRLHYGLSLDRCLFNRYGAFREDLRAGEDTEFRERLAGKVRIASAADVVSAQPRMRKLIANTVRDTFRPGHLQDLFDRYSAFREDSRAGAFCERPAGKVRIAWASDVVSAHRYPTTMRELIRDAFRRGRLQAAMIGMIWGGGPKSLRVGFWGSVGSVHALRLALATRGTHRRRLLRAWPLVLPASIAFAAGGLSARLRPYDGKRAPTVIRRVSDCTRPLLALTFDDGPSDSTAELLDVLRRHKTRATFFVIGETLPRYEALLLRMATDGHEIGNHLETHTAPDLLSPRQLRAELARTAQRIELAVSTPPRLVRPPYGNGVERVARVARDLKLGEVVLWSIDPRDWTDLSPWTLARRVVARAQPGDIILLHDRPMQKNGERWRTTIASLEELIPALQERGYEFVTVSELIASRRRRRGKEPKPLRPDRSDAAVSTV